MLKGGQVHEKACPPFLYCQDTTIARYALEIWFCFYAMSFLRYAQSRVAVPFERTSGVRETTSELQYA